MPNTETHWPQRDDPDSPLYVHPFWHQFDRDSTGAVSKEGWEQFEEWAGKQPPSSALSFARAEVKLRNWRGTTTPEIVYELLDHRARRDQLSAELETPIPEVDHGSIEERKSGILIENCYITACLMELDRREHINKTQMLNPERPLIQAIKEANKVEDIIEQYSPITYQSKSLMRFRCLLHGSEDKTPSGVIYVSEHRWHCFGCNRGGDCIDAEVVYGRVTIPEALRRLASRGGIELRPLHEKPAPKYRGGIDI